VAARLIGLPSRPVGRPEWAS